MGGNREGHNAVVPPQPNHYDNPDPRGNYVPAPGRTLPPRAPDLDAHLNFDFHNQYDPQD